jgi:O-methyltransferase
MILNFNRVQSQLINQPLHSIIRPWATYSPWLLDPIFKECYDKMKTRTLVDEYRCFELWQIALQQQKVKGNFLEVGVWQGGTALLLGKSLENSDKKLYLADTFSGVVNASEVDSNYIGGEHSDTSVDFVTEFLNSELQQNFELLIGEFPTATGDLVSGPLSFVHIDVDVYNSGKSILDWCRTRMSPNGVIIFDDYGFLSTDGITKLVNENFVDDDFLIVYNLNGHAILVKRS